MNHHEHQHQLELPSPPNTPLRRGGVVSKRRRFTHTCSSHQHLLMPSSPSYTHEKNITHTHTAKPKDTITNKQHTCKHTHTHTVLLTGKPNVVWVSLRNTHAPTQHTHTNNVSHSQKTLKKKKSIPKHQHLSLCAQVALAAARGRRVWRLPSAMVSTTCLWANCWGRRWSTTPPATGSGAWSLRSSPTGSWRRR